jgi:phospholipid/cholesterol/gamma-HCH transport system ATP-binding protein
MINSEANLKPIIEIKNLYTAFYDDYVHENLNLTIYPNRIITIIGESGCGKTTLIREILALQQPLSGTISIAGNPINNFNIEHPDTRKMLSNFGMMFQHGALFSSLSVIENVMYPIIEYTNFSLATIKEVAEIKLQLTGLSKDAYHKYPTELSGGMLKRVALARALALYPSVIFLDEPTAGLDPNSASDLDMLIYNLQKQLNLTVVIITHDLNTIWGISDEIIYMGDKRVLFHDTVENAASAKHIPQLYNYFNGIRGTITKQYYTNLSGAAHE